MSNNDFQFYPHEWWKPVIFTLIVIGLAWVVLKDAGLAKEKEVKEKSITTEIKEATSFFEILTVPNEAKDLIKKHEGIRDKVYHDTEGIPTIGVGFNLYRKDAVSRISSLGLNYQSVLDGETSLTDRQIENLFEYDLMRAVSNASRFLPNFEQQPKEIKIVVVNMAYNLGLTRLNKFVKFRQALMDNNYLLAADEMINSKWYNQVGNRSKELTTMVALSVYK